MFGHELLSKLRKTQKIYSLELEHFPISLYIALFFKGDRYSLKMVTTAQPS